VQASIVAESYSGHGTACAAARRHGLSPSQLFTCRRELRKQFEDQGLMVPTTTSPPSFVPAVIDPLAPSDPAPAVMVCVQSRSPP